MEIGYGSFSNFYLDYLNVLVIFFYGKNVRMFFMILFWDIWDDVFKVLEKCLVYRRFKVFYFILLRGDWGVEDLGFIL